MRPSVLELAIYPVKSCQGIALDRAEILDTGLRHDRRWMIIDEAGGFLTQRQHPKLARVSTRLEAGSLLLRSPGKPELRIAESGSGPARPVQVWKDQALAFDEGQEAADWCAELLGIPVRLVRFDLSRKRLCDPVYAAGSGAHTLFADGYPLLVANQASLDELNRHMDVELPMNRFRPNIVCSGVEAFDEDHITRMRIGKISLRLVKPCTRCVITTTDQRTGEVGSEPLPTLSRRRFDPALGGVTFGMNAIVEEGAGETLQRGAEIALEWAF